MSVETDSINVGTLPTIRATALAKRVALALFKPVDISVLVYFRICFGAIMLWEVYRFFTANWISRYYIEPAVHFTYYGFSWVKPWPGNGMYVHFFILGIAAACIIIGFCYRIAAATFFLGFTYVFLLEHARYLNHFYLVCLVSFVLIFIPAHRAVSVDSLIRRRIRADMVPAWSLWLLRIQIGIAYFYGGIAKLNHDWVFGGEPMRIWLSPFVNLPLFGPIVRNETVVYAFAYGGLLLDLFVVPLLLWRKTRPFALIAAIGFNLLNSILFNIGIFPWFMLAASLIFFPPDLFRRLMRAIKAPGHSGLEPESPNTSEAAPATVQKPDAPRELTTSQRRVVWLMGIYLAIQFLFPLRHFLYPGNVSWTEEGHNFAWHMKLRTKTGTAVFTITHPQTGQTWTVDSKNTLPEWQREKMSTKPDLIVQYSHYLAEQKRREGFDNVEVRALVTTSLNGRKPQLLIDPNVDLAKQNMSLRPASYILPLTTPLEIRGGATEGDEDAEN